MPVITIARQYGAGGSAVARLVAGALGVDVLDKYLIAEVARRLGLPAADVEAVDEHPRGLVELLVRPFAYAMPGPAPTWEPPYPDPFYDPRRAVLDLTRQVILEVARTGNAVILGRGSSVILRDRPGVTHVFLCAPLEARIETVMQRDLVSEPVARRRIHEVDANRREFLRQVHGVDWQDPTGYTLCLNTAQLGYARTAELILSAAGCARSAADPKGA